jgi:ligand-binding sensor domain-containing protein
MEIVQKAILIWILTLLLALSSSGQGYYNYELKSLTVNDNLSHSDVNCIVQGEDGFIWIGTNNGLNKYNGFEIETFNYRVDDPKSLPGNRIN